MQYTIAWRIAVLHKRNESVMFRLVMQWYGDFMQETVYCSTKFTIDPSYQTIRIIPWPKLRP
jgi:hypothetical protein